MTSRVFAASISGVIAIISVLIMIAEGTITPEAWALLLLTPIPVGIAITRRHDSADVSVDSVTEWADDNEDHKEGSLGDPADAGFDLPVL